MQTLSRAADFGLSAIKSWKGIATVMLAMAACGIAPAAGMDTLVADQIQLENDGGTFVVPVLINGAITLRFTIDSGAADVAIPADVVSTLLRTGTVSSADFIGNKTFVLADGSQIPSAEFRIRSLTLGAVTLHDVVASISSRKGDLLLGQTFLRRLSSWSIDNERQLLIMNATSLRADGPVYQGSKSTVEPNITSRKSILPDPGGPPINGERWYRADTSYSHYTQIREMCIVKSMRNEQSGVIYRNEFFNCMVDQGFRLDAAGYTPQMYPRQYFGHVYEEY